MNPNSWRKAVHPSSHLCPPLPLRAFLVFTCLFIHCFDLQLTANETVYCSLLLFLLLLLSRVLSLNLSQTPSLLSPDWTVHALTVAVVLLFVSSFFLRGWSCTIADVDAGNYPSSLLHLSIPLSFDPSPHWFRQQHVEISSGSAPRLISASSNNRQTSRCTSPGI